MTNFEDVYSNAPKAMPLTLISITHKVLGELNLTNDNTEHTYFGKKYVPYYYEISYPDESDDSDNSGRIIMASLDDNLKAVARSGGRDILLTIEAQYLGEDGGFSPLSGAMQFSLSNITLSVTSISANLVKRNILQDAFPGHIMSATNCPGLS